MFAAVAEVDGKLVNGAFVVLVTVSAFRLLHLGPSGVGYLNAAVGAGGLVGGLLSLLLVGHRRLATVFGVAGVATSGFVFRFPDFKAEEIAGREEWKERQCFLMADQSWPAWNGSLLQS